MGIFALGILTLTSVHISEFFIESQKIFTISDSLMDVWEFAATYMGVLILFWGVNRIAWPNPLEKKSL